MFKKLILKHFAKEIVSNIEYSTRTVLDNDYEHAKNLIKEATALKKENKIEEAILLINKALEIEFVQEWKIKQINYIYSSGNSELAVKELQSELERSKKNIDYFSQFTWDVFYYDRLRIWEKDKIKKEKLEVLVDNKSFIGGVLNASYISIDAHSEINNLKKLFEYHRHDLENLLFAKGNKNKHSKKCLDNLHQFISTLQN